MIEVDDRHSAGTKVAWGFIGPDGVEFEIFVKNLDPTYWVGGIRVTRETYLDALLTADKDRFQLETCPDCGHVHGENAQELS